MAIETMRYIRKPLYVDAVRITGANFDEVAAWCQGEVSQDEVPGKGTTKKFIKVRVHYPKNARQTKAFIGDWLLYTERGYKVYTNKAFQAAFDEAPPEAPSNGSVEVHPGNAPGLEVAPGITVSQGVQVNRPSQLDQIRQLESTGLTYVQIGEQLGLSVDEVSALANNGRAPMPHRNGVANVEDVPAQESIVPAAAEGKRVLSIAEQKELTADEVRELVQAGEAVLAQDLPEA